MTPEVIVLACAASGALAALAWFSARFAWWRRALPYDRPRVLMYHMVSPHRPGAKYNKLRLPPARFARQIDHLARSGWTFVLASEVASGAPLPRKSVCITFDDGFADNLLAADPVLARHNARATLYLVGDLADTRGWSSKKKAHHTDDELASEPKLTDDQVRELLATGRWELGGHTITHAHLPSISDEDARREIEHARDDFPARFGASPPTFAYPFGHFEQRHAAMVKHAGYVGAFTASPGIDPHPAPDPLAIPRIKVSGKDSMLAFRMRLRAGKRGLRK
jgi:peptidoglycan/xylan/chitin deacetylase (PgdA/CDA1 family)